MHYNIVKEGGLKKRIDRFQPDVVIYEYAERKLDSPNQIVLENIERSLGY
jgi:hypothetical protein